MPRTRRARLESAYERRIRRGMERGLTREEARGHKAPKGRSEFQERVRRYRKRYPDSDVTQKEAGGHDPERAKERREREADINDFLDYLEPNDVIMLADHISTIRRQDDGTWQPHEKRILPANEQRDVREFVLPAMSDERLERLIQQELQTGAQMTPIPSLDQTRLAR